VEKVDDKRKVLILDEHYLCNNKDISNCEVYRVDYIKKVTYENEYWFKLLQLIEETGIVTIIASQKDINIVSRLLWECKTLKDYILTDTSDPLICESYKKQVNTVLWDMVAAKSHSEDAIVQSGWKSSYTGEYLSTEEMIEYSQNVFLKLKPYLSTDKRVLEIGVGSGFTCFEVAPYVKEYNAIDLSIETIKKTQNNASKKGINNLICKQLGADEISSEIFTNIDIVIINSVAQYFPGYNYFIDIMKRCIEVMNSTGIIFVGDVMDLELKKKFILSLTEYRQTYSDASTIMNSKKNLYYPRSFFEQLPGYCHEVQDVMIDEKIGEIKNELRLFRYDVTLLVDKESYHTVDLYKTQRVL